MTLNEYQDLAQRTARITDTGMDKIANGCMGLCGESGECIDLLKKWGIPVSEDRLPIADVMQASKDGKLEEVFGTGTAAVISPVGELRYEGDVAYINNGEIGEISHKLYDTLTGIQWGKLPDTKGWIVPVE